MKYFIPAVSLLMALCNTQAIANPLTLHGLVAPTCNAETPNIRPPDCVDYKRVFSRISICSSANPSVVPPNCSAIDEPDLVLTPGSSFPIPQLADICDAGYVNSIPLPSTLLNETIQQLFVSYTFPFKDPIGPCYDATLTKPNSGCIVDNLIPIGLGGDNTLANLWPQPINGLWTSTMKNTLETTLRSRICTITAPHTSTISIEIARAAIKNNWKGAYVKYVVNQE